MDEIGKIELRHLTIEDYEGLKKSMIAAYENWQGVYWKEEQITKLLNVFPEGQIAILVDDKVAGCALSIIVKYDHFGDSHTFREITGNYTFTTHAPTGDILYGIEVFIVPEFRGLRLGRRLYDARKELCEKLNLKAIVFGGRIPKYHEYAAELTPKDIYKK
jgi:GNAT superfamily N-acetyltransferase